MFDVLDAKTAWLILHLFGVVLGAGGAFMSDVLYLSSVKDGRITATEERFLKLGSYMVWTGVCILIISGIGLFSLQPQTYLDSSKFLTKMAIVAVIILNGAIFHFVHMPVLVKTAHKNMRHSRLFVKMSPYIYASGAISIVSWISTIILGSLRSIPYTFTEAFGVYLVVLVVAVTLSAFSRKSFLAK